MTVPPRSPPACIFAPSGGRDDLVDELVAIGYPIHGVVGGYTGGADVAVVDEAAALEALSRDPALEVILAPHPPNAAAEAWDCFAQTALKLPAHTRLLSPAATIPHFGVTYAHRFAKIGYPGSGNVLTTQILHRVQGMHGPLPLDRRQRICRALGVEQAYLLRGFVDAVLGHPDGAEYNFAKGIDERAEVRARFPDGRFVVLQQLPYAGDVGANFGSHPVMTPELRHLLDGFGYRWFRTVRHPLDVVASLAAKVVRPPSIAVADRAWLEGIAKGMVINVRAAQLISDTALLVRYEDLVTTPIVSIRALADHLGLPVSEAQAEAIWKEVGFRELTPAGKEHLYRPGQSKRHLFDAAALDVLRAAGLADLTTELGYDWPESAELAPAADTEPAEIRHISPVFGSVNYRSDVYVREVGVSSWRCLSSHPDLADEIIARMRQPAFARFAGSLGPLAPPQTVDWLALEGVVWGRR